MSALSSGAWAQPATLPAPTRTPLAIDGANDPLLALGRTATAPDDFKATIAAAVARHPALGEADANEAEARAARGEARTALFPSGQASISNYQVLARDFSNDPENIIERSRARRRTDALLTVQQNVFDFGATSRRVSAATARLRAAEADVSTAADQVALRTIAAWYDVFAYRALVSLAETFAANQRELRGAVSTRIRQGVSAEGDLAQVDSYIGSADRRVAEFTRSRAEAEARYASMVGAPPSPSLGRAPLLGGSVMSKDFAETAATTTPAVIAADAVAKAGDDEARAARAARFPNVRVGVDAGRYGVFENDRDYDVRANVTVRQPLFGGIESRATAAQARANSAEARARRIREEAVRDAAIAWSDVAALETELAALEASYLASRVSRDVLVERFRVARGSLFDVLAAEDNLFASAAAYIRSLTERDTARYTLLSRTGKLLPALDIAPGSATRPR